MPNVAVAVAVEGGLVPKALTEWRWPGLIKPT